MKLKTLSLMLCLVGFAGVSSYATAANYVFRYPVYGVKASTNINDSQPKNCEPSEYYEKSTTDQEMDRFSVYQQGMYISIYWDGSLVFSGNTATNEFPELPTFDSTYPYWLGQKQPGYTQLNNPENYPNEFQDGYGVWSVYDYSDCTIEEAKDFINDKWSY